MVFASVNASDIRISDKLRAQVEHRGAAGSAWLAGLPATIARLETAWDMKVGRGYGSGTEAYTAEAVLADGTEAALKLPIAGLEKGAREARMLDAAGGQGYVRLLRWDPETNAMLLERLGVQLHQLGLPMERQIEIICALLRKAWRQPPSGLELLTGAEKAAAMAAYIETVWNKLGRPCSDRTYDTALRFLSERRDAFDPKTAVMAHGDAHAWNTLQDPKANGFKLVDPDGLFIERAHDLSISMREWSVELEPDPVARGRERCALLSRLTGVDVEPIWQWGLIERLVNGLSYLEVGPTEYAPQFLTVAQAWAHAS
ncbi:MAG: aminoglycoside phosphotransferase [Alphaproteobacteria bacterium]|nr:aminoglycoside phosphotransferase [Alphaproteobacteria bacterium]MBL6940196.1 aminoglycoside phosphotransferase [Alphaproteobacteria bacterium]MBL7096896.1 aminoglycoside phosphotransferase [Alphaproteobacteria bacterium]